MAKTIRKKLAGEGGSIERDYVRRWAQRQIDMYPHDAEVLWGLIEWLDKQPKRTRRPGGLGKR